MMRRLLGYAAYMSAATFLLKGVGFVITMLGARVRPKEAFGEYTTFSMIVGFGHAILIGGVNQAVQRYAAHSDENRARFAAMAVRAFAVLVAIAGLLFAASIPRLGLGQSLAFLTVPCVAVINWGRYLFRSRLHARAEARLMAFIEISVSLLQFALLAATGLRAALIYGNFAAHALAAVIALAAIPSAAGVPVRTLMTTRVPLDFLRDVARFAAPLWIATMVFAIAFHLQGGWIAIILGAAAMGTNGIVAELWQILAIPMDIAGQAALPGLAGERDNRRALFLDLARMCIVLFPVMAIGLSAASPLILLMMDGGLGAAWAAIQALLGNAPTAHGAGDTLLSKFSEVPLLLQIVALDVPFRAFQIVANQYAVAEGRSKVSLTGQIAQLVVVAALLYPMSKTWGLPGLMVAADFGTMANALTLWAILRKEYGPEVGTAMRWTVIAWFACAISLVPVFLTNGTTWAWAVAVPAASLYVLGLLASGVVAPRDVSRMKGLLVRTR